MYKRTPQVDPDRTYEHFKGKIESAFEALYCPHGDSVAIHDGMTRLLRENGIVHNDILTLFGDIGECDIENFIKSMNNLMLTRDKLHESFWRLTYICDDYWLSDEKIPKLILKQTLDGNPDFLREAVAEIPSVKDRLDAIDQSHELTAQKRDLKKRVEIEKMTRFWGALVMNEPPESFITLHLPPDMYDDEVVDEIASEVYEDVDEHGNVIYREVFVEMGDRLMDAIGRLDPDGWGVYDGLSTLVYLESLVVPEIKDEPLDVKEKWKKRRLDGEIRELAIQGRWVPFEKKLKSAFYDPLYETGLLQEVQAIVQDFCEWKMTPGIGFI